LKYTDVSEVLTASIIRAMIKVDVLQRDYITLYPGRLISRIEYAVSDIVGNKRQKVNNGEETNVVLRPA
jgi:hypothetical protein